MQVPRDLLWKSLLEGYLPDFLRFLSQMQMKFLILRKESSF